MAQTKGNIEEGNPYEGQNVLTTTEDAPHAADKSSQPGPYADLEVNRPPVSTNDPETPIAQSLVGGAGAPTGPPEIHPETHVASNAYVTSADKDNVEKVVAPKAAQ